MKRDQRIWLQLRGHNDARLGKMIEAFKETAAARQGLKGAREAYEYGYNRGLVEQAKVQAAIEKKNNAENAKWTDRATLLAIAKVMDGQEWTPDTLDAIAVILRTAGYTVRDSAEVRHVAVEKQWHQRTLEEKEEIRQDRLRDRGGAECDGCGKEEYEQSMTEHDGKQYCSDCCEELEIEEAS